jgi:hypothetical protein
MRFYLADRQASHPDLIVLPWLYNYQAWSDIPRRQDIKIANILRYGWNHPPGRFVHLLLSYKQFLLERCNLRDDQSGSRQECPSQYCLPLQCRLHKHTFLVEALRSRSSQTCSTHDRLPLRLRHGLVRLTSKARSRSFSISRRDRPRCVLFPYRLSWMLLPAWRQRFLTWTRKT